MRSCAGFSGFSAFSSSRGGRNKLPLVAVSYRPGLRTKPRKARNPRASAAEPFDSPHSDSPKTAAPVARAGWKVRFQPALQISPITTAISEAERE